MKPRHIVYVTGTRADFGLMRRTLLHINSTPGLQLSIIATGQHFNADLGNTIDEVRASGLTIAAEIPVVLTGTDGAEMGRAVSHELAGLIDVLPRCNPDLLLVLGDRGEMLAAAIAALHLNIPVAHLHGGERSGTIDEPVRHAISKLAHFHLPATEDSQARLVRLGEDPTRIRVVGAPGLVGLAEDLAAAPGDPWKAKPGPGGAPRAVLLHHAVVQDSCSADNEVATIIDALALEGFETLALLPNSDAGGLAIGNRIANRAAVAGSSLRCVAHLSRPEFLRAVKEADLLVGNSSSGIIESASLGTACVNIGRRQSHRQRNMNTVNVEVSHLDSVREGIRQAQQLGRGPWPNVYGDGNTHERIVATLFDLPLDHAILHKLNTY